MAMGAMNGTFLEVFEMVEGRDTATEGSRVRDITEEGYNTYNK